MSKKKEKITYVDDGRTIADMSGVGGGSRLNDRNPYRPSPKFKDVWKTYWSAVRMMFVPMLVVIAIIGVIYLLAYLALAYLA
ncbi:MAG: hypothetical protein IJW14_05240 [Oscillospiraceae bacterium]|nr:hypothetical protein [Oscillospiraceae bacterium]